MKILFLHLITVNRGNRGYAVTALGLAYLMYTQVHETYLLIILEENFETVFVRLTYLVCNKKSCGPIFSQTTFFSSHIYNFTVDL